VRGVGSPGSLGVSRRDDEPVRVHGAVLRIRDHGLASPVLSYDGPECRAGALLVQRAQLGRYGLYAGAAIVVVAVLIAAAGPKLIARIR
jgi:hypothetical protein